MRMGSRAGDTSSRNQTPTRLFVLAYRPPSTPSAPALPWRRRGAARPASVRALAGYANDIRLNGPVANFYLASTVVSSNRISSRQISQNLRHYSIAQPGRFVTLRTTKHFSGASENEPPVPSPTRDQRPSVRLNQGTYIGTVLAEPEYPRAVEALLGVSYAKCERLRRAVPLGASGDTLDASDYGPVCPTADPSFPSDEHCLNANVFRPATAGGNKGVPDATAESKKVPVLVYFHGGAFNFGRGGDRNLAAFVAFAKRDLVAVSFNYRLGPLGFLPCGLAATEGVANIGLLDQRALLQWVQRNIGAFGGNEKDVTVMGFSAGAHSHPYASQLGHHLLSPSSRALFYRAILESGAPTARSVLSSTHPRHEAQFAQFLRHASVSSYSPTQVLPALRALPLRTLLQASLATWTECAPSVQWPFQPSVDGDGDEDSVIPSPPIKTWTSPSLPPPPP
ncbi:carboxylesterase [Colletotrichum tofieldiae]|nr:carboxylesterase [Colletotrichum tofieldiae]